ncbi:MAG: GTPase Der [Alphaproteobacteria bacterium ADurb.Bin438]|nr:MAG: GTPase Der [Alphaproteobacteria bacterium ADurb.Bin438]
MRVSIVGRANVGKSTIFNRLVGKKKAITRDISGVTRDRIEDAVDIRGKKISFVDTAGFDNSKDKMTKLMVEQSLKSLEDADLVLFIVDAKDLENPFDKEVAKALRKSEKKIILIANKCDNFEMASNLDILTRHGFGEAMPMSAEHNIGFQELFDIIMDNYVENEESDEGDEKYDLKMTFLGRPNVGKSSLINAILREKRLVTSDVAGTTRDAISLDFMYGDKKVKIVDTAGLRKKARVVDDLEKASGVMSNNEVRFSEVVVLVTSSETLLEKQDLTLARKVIEEGRVLIIVVNKFDLVTNHNKLRNDLNDTLASSLSQLEDVTVLYTSALKEKNVDDIIFKSFEAYEKWNKRVSTGKLNQFFEGVIERNPPPLSQNKRVVKLKYITQSKTRPPTFTIFSGNKEKPPESYQRYLLKAIRETFDFKGIPLRLNIKAPKNPYTKK